MVLMVLENLIYGGNFCYKFVDFNLIKWNTELKDDGKFFIRSSLQTKTQIKSFECYLWVDTKREEQETLTVDTSCKCRDIILVEKYFRFIRNKEYKSRLGKFDYGK